MLSLGGPTFKKREPTFNVSYFLVGGNESEESAGNNMLHEIAEIIVHTSI